MGLPLKYTKRLLSAQENGPSGHRKNNSLIF